MLNWYRFSGEKVLDLKDAICEHITTYGAEGLDFFVGTDSQPKTKIITYVTVVVVYRHKKGGIVFYKRENESNVDRRYRLWNETYKAVQTALELNEFLREYDLKVSEIHADLNSDKKFLSNSSVQACLGFICSMGFNGKIKPEAWAATKVANRKTKKRKKNK